MKQIIGKITAKFTAILKNKTSYDFFLLPIDQVPGKKIFKQLGFFLGGRFVLFLF